MATRRSNGRIWIIVFLLLLVLNAALVLLLVRGLQMGQWPFVPKGGAGGTLGEIAEVLSEAAAYCDENAVQMPAAPDPATVSDPAIVPDPDSVPASVSVPAPVTVPDPGTAQTPPADTLEDIRTVIGDLTDEARIWIDPDTMSFDSAAERYEMAVTLTLMQRHGRAEVEKLQPGDTIRFGNETIAIRAIAFHDGRTDGEDGGNNRRYCSINDEEWALVYDADHDDYYFAYYWEYDSYWYVRRYEAGQYLVRVSPDAELYDACFCIYSDSPSENGDYIRVAVPDFAAYLAGEIASAGDIFPVECKARFDADGMLTYLWILYME